MARKGSRRSRCLRGSGFEHRARLVLDYLAAERIPADKVAKVCAPAGSDLGAVTSEEIALSIMSQIVAVRRGGTSKTLHLRETGLTLAGDALDRVINQCDVPGSDG